MSVDPILRLAAPSAQRLARLIVAGLAAACTVAPSTAPSVAPTVSPGSTDCPIVERQTNLISDRLVAVRVETGVVADRVVFTFGIRSTAPTRPALRIAEVQPPFSRGASGLPVVVEGRRFLDVRFDGLLLFDAAGTPALSGDRDLHPNGLAIREVVNLDESEGVSDWVLGLSSGGCVEVSSPLPIELVVTVAH